MATQSRLTLGALQTEIAVEGGATVHMALGPEWLVEQAFRSRAPNAAHLETAINLVEDAIGATGWRRMPRGALLIDAQSLRQAIPVLGLPAHLSLEEVEQHYQDIALVAQRQPGLPFLALAPQAVAALILVRECMHHLGYETLVVMTQ